MKKLTCVILDDDILMVKLLESVIQKDGRLELLATYHTSHDAIFDFVNVKPDLLFLDINLPTLDGVDVLAVLDDNRPQTIVVSSEKERFSEFEEFEEVIGFIEKPMNFDDYTSLVDKALEVV